MTTDVELNGARENAYSHVDDTYAITLASIVCRFMPDSIKSKLISPDEYNQEDGRLSQEMYIRELASVIDKVLPREEFKERIEKKLNSFDLDLEEAFRLLTVDEIVNTAEDTRVTLIAEADTKEDVQNNVKDLTDMLSKENIPNIIKTIADTVSKELQQSNKELKNIEDTEVKLVISTTDSPATEDASVNNDPYGILAGGNLDDDSDIDTTSDTSDSDDSGEDNSENGSNEDKDGTEETPEDDGEDADVPEVIAGEDGETYSEAVRIKYAEALNSNLVYRIKNATSKLFYAVNKDSDGEPIPVFENKIIGIAYGMIVFGFIVDLLGILPKEELADRFDAIVSEGE